MDADIHGLFTAKNAKVAKFMTELTQSTLMLGPCHSSPARAVGDNGPYLNLVGGSEFGLALKDGDLAGLGE